MSETLTVVTICFNNLEEVRATCYSVDAQGRKPEEHLIIDGSSGKEILHWLENSPQPPYRKWLHERDNGISDAFNKGVMAARYTVIHLLNSGDLYQTENTIQTVMTAFDTDAALTWVHGSYVQHRGGVDVVSGKPFDPDKLWKGMRTVAHPTMFIKKQLYLNHGLYDTTLRIAMDYDLLLRIRNEKFKFIEAPLVYFKPGGASSVQFKRGLEEVRMSYRKHFGKDNRQSLWQFRQKMLHKAMSTTVGRILFRIKNSRKMLTRSDK